MEAILRSEITKTIDMSKLRKLLPTYATVKRYDQLRGKTLKEVMGRYKVIILLWNLHDKKHRTLNKAGHFYVINTLDPEHECVIFSSTGMSYKKELFITQSDPTLFERILPKDTIYNDHKFQINDDSNTCWRYCIVYSYFAHIPLSKFKQLFSKSINLHTSDQLITMATLITLF